MRRAPILPCITLLLVLPAILAATPTSAFRTAAEAAPLAAVSLGLIPASGPPGTTITAVGSGWTFGNSPYAILWEVHGGTQLGTFAPDGPGNWSTAVTIPGEASAGPHTVVACEGYTTEFEQCASATFTVVPPTATITPTRTRTPTPPPGAVTPFTRTPTRTPSITPPSGCRDEVIQVSPLDFEDLGGVATTDLVLDVVITRPEETRVRIFTAGIETSPLYSQWPDPSPGTTVDTVPHPTDPHRWRLTVRDVPVAVGYNLVGVDLSPTCGYAEEYFQFTNGDEPTATPRPDVCGGLGLPSDATVVDFELGAPGLDRLAREQGVRFEGYLEVRDPRPVLARSGSLVGASIEGLEFGSATLPIRMAFDRPLAALGMFAGFPEPQYATGNVVARLSAYGYRAGGGEMVLLGGDSTTFPAAPTDVVHCLRFSAAEGDLIVRALVEYTDADGNSLAERRLIDDLTLAFADGELPPDRPPTVEIQAPADGSSIPGTTIHLRATVWEDVELERVAYQIDGGEETELGASPSLTDPAAFMTGVNFSAAILEPGVPHLLSVTAFDRAGQFGQDTVTIIVPTPVPTVDLQAVGMEIVQVVQCMGNPRCADNAVPMVMGKPTWVRVYLRAEGGVPEGAISGRLCPGRVATCDTGFVVPMNEIIPDEDEDPIAADRGSLDDTLNFLLPFGFLTEGRLELTAFINYREGDADELNTDNNAVQAAVSVVPARALTVMFMPVTADGVRADIAEMFTFADWLARVFPVARITAVGRAPLPGDFDLSDSSGDNCGRTWNRLMDTLRGAYTWGGRGAAYLFGLVPGTANTDSVLGCGETPGRVASGVTTGGTRWGPIIGAQELGHNFGRRHATRACDAGNPDPSYPRRAGLLDEWGVDLAVRQIYSPFTSYDYMGYCGGPDNTWTSVYTYLSLIDALPVAAEPASGAHLASHFRTDGAPSLIGGGQISPEAFILERGFYRASVAAGTEDDLPPGPYTAMLLDADGARLFARDFGVIPLSNHEASDAGYVQLILPDLPGVAEIVFLHNGSPIGQVSTSAHPPQVSIVDPPAGEDWGASGAHSLAWQASDADEDPLRFNVQVSADGGVSWSALALDLAEATSISLDSADLPGGNLLFRVLASDGLNTAESATTAPVVVGNKPPQMHLASPVEGVWIPVGEAAVFRGYATDLEDVVLADDAFRWSSDLDGDLGAGPTLWGIALSPGSHRITLTVTDRAGSAVSESASITVGGSPEASTTEAGSPPLAIALFAAGVILLVGAGIGALIYALRPRPARR